MSFIDKLRQTFSKTRQKFSSKLENESVELKKVDDDFFADVEEMLIVADVGVSTATKIVDTLKSNVKKMKLKFQHEAKAELINIITNLLKCVDNVDEIYETKPRVILVLGVNGVGKTTTIAKLAQFYKNRNKKVVLAAADSFRAAAVEQLTIWAKRVGCELVSHGQNCDPASVVFDAIAYAHKNEFDFVICDTAGRLHNKKNLMSQLEKIIRIAKKAHGSEIEILLVIDSTIGQNSLNQVDEFKKVAKLDGVILTKLDGTAKGGVAVALVSEKQVAIRFLGLGESVSDLHEFEAESFAKAMFS